jgi:endoglucanase
MRNFKAFRKIIAYTVTLSMVLSSAIGKSKVVFAEENSKTPSQLYVEAMGNGWNLGNSFDGFDADLNKEDGGELAWGNPTVTKELIHSIKEKGYDSIRIPMTSYRRYSEVEGKYVLDSNWLERYKEVVNLAVDEGLYVMVNMHHDSWIWLSNWDGNKDSEEYKRFVDIWGQLADAFKDFSDKVSFETINEPSFNDTGDIKAQDKLDMINMAAYNTIRNSGGNNTTRMIIIPTMHTNHGTENSSPTYNFIKSLNDENIIATVHYYSEWVFSANLGITDFDEPLYDWSNEYTARAAANDLFNILNNTFTSNGIGVVIGEWGLLGYDAGSEVNQLGEELKYYEYMNYLARENAISLMFWDNGSGINRLDTENYSWKKPIVGEMLDAGVNGQRSSYATDLNTVYLSEASASDLEIKLTLNGNTFEGIQGLIEGADYIYNEENATITLLSKYINNKFNNLDSNEYGEIDDLLIKFSSGAKWHQYLVKYSKPVLSETTGTTSNVSIPVDFNGAKLRRVTAFDESENRVGPNSSWWGYLQLNGAFSVDYNNGTIDILNNFFNDSSVQDGKVKFTFEFYDGQIVNYTLVKDGENVTGVPEENNQGELPDDNNPGENPDDNNSGENPDDDNNSGQDTDDNNLGQDVDDKNQNKITNNKLPQTGVNNPMYLLIAAVLTLGAGSTLVLKRKKVN